MTWTDERIEILKKLWADGLSASQIAVEMGGVSRNSVIGKVHRLGLSGRVKPGSRRNHNPRIRSNWTKEQDDHLRDSWDAGVAITYIARDLKRGIGTVRDRVEHLGLSERKHQNWETRRSKPATIPRFLNPPPPAPVIAPEPRKLALVQLTESTCKWPIGDPQHPDFHFCGNHSGEDGPYCEFHQRMAYVPMSSRDDMHRAARRRRLEAAE